MTIGARLWLWVALASLLAVGCSSATRIDEGIAFVDVTVVDVSGDSVLSGVTVVVSGERISHMIPSENVRVGPDVERVDGSGRFLIPGLWDMHVHLQGTAKDVRAVEFPVYVANGITGMRVMSGCDSTYVADRPEMAPCMSEDSPGSPTADLVRAWRDEIANNRMVGPRIVAPSMMFDGQRLCYPAYALASADEARERVRQAQQSGVDFLKIFNCSMSPELYHAIADEAQGLGMVLAGHVPSGVTLMEASNAGQKGLDHAAPSLLEACAPQDRVIQARAAFTTGGFSAYLRGLIAAFDSALCDELVETMLTNRTALSPTFLVNTNNVVNPDLRAAVERDDRWRYLVAHTRDDWHRGIEEQTIADSTRTLYAEYFEKLYEAVVALERGGVPILAGSDAPNLLVYPGSGLHDELAFLVDAGLSPAAALAAATTTPARYFDRDDLGSVAPGMLADLVLLDANPLTEIRNTRRIVAVMAGGRLFGRASLDSLLGSAARNAAAIP